VLADHAGHVPGLGSDEQARALATRLGGLPLALKIAGSYLAETAKVPAAFAGQDSIRSYRQYQDAIDSAALSQDVIGHTWEMSLELLDIRQLPEARYLLRLLATFAGAPVPYELLLYPAIIARTSLFEDINGSRLWQVLQALDSFGLISLSPGIADDIAVAVLHPLVRDASRSDACLPYLEIAALLLEHAAEQIPDSPEDPPTWPAWQLLAPHAIHVLNALAGETERSDSATLAAANAAFLCCSLPCKQWTAHRRGRAPECPGRSVAGAGS
jgi:hypothetical protein